MRLASILSHVALHSLLDAAGDKLAKWIDDYCRNPTQALPKAMAEANRQTWRAVELALAGDRLLGKLRQRLASGLHQGALAPLNTWLDRQPAGFRAECLAELQAARKAELLDVAFGQELARLEDGLERYASSAEVIDQAHRAMAAGAEGLRSEYPRLASLLEQREAGGPLLVALFGYFLNQAIGHDKELREELDFKHLRQLWQGQNEGFQALHQLLAELGEELAAAFAVLATHIDGRFDRLEGGLADLQAEIRQHFERLRQPGPASPRLTQLIQDPRERQAVRQLMQRYRALPEAQRRRLPELINQLGKLQLAAGELDEAERLFQEAADAEGHYNRYRVLLEERRWEEALSELRQAAEADPARFAPFPLAKYPPQRILGAGGFGVAFLCQHAHLRHPVVVKSLHATDLECNVADILREGRTLKTLRHPAIIQVDDSDYADPGQQRPYLVLEHFADSQSLGAYLEAHGPLPLADSLAIAHPVAEALAAAHQAGILHRDLKPDNLLVKREANGRWQVKLIDFGMALRQKLVKETLATSSFQHSLLGQSLGGTYRFAAPEQLGLRPEPVGPYSDVYGYGKTLCYALFQITEPTMEEWSRIGFDHPLVKLLNRCIHADPSRRPRGFQEVLQALETIEGKAAPVTPTAPTRQDDRPAHSPPVTQVSGTPRATHPYLLQKQECWTDVELATRLAQQWSDGVKDLQRGYIGPWLQHELHDQDAVRLLADLLEDRNLTPDQRLLALIRHLDPRQPPIWKGKSLAAADLADLARRAVEGNTASRDALAEIWKCLVLRTLAQGGHPALGDIQTRWEQADAVYDQGWPQLIKDGVPSILRPGQPMVLPALLLTAMDKTFAQELRVQARQGHEADAKDCGWYPALAGLDVNVPAQALIFVRLLPKAADCGREARRKEAEREEKERLAAEKEAKRWAEEQRKQTVKRRWIFGFSLGLTVFLVYRQEQDRYRQEEVARQEEKASRERARQEEQARQESIRIMEENMVLVKGGTFQMGSPETEKDRSGDERQHAVTVKDFKIGRYEVTQAQWQTVMGSDSLKLHGCGDCPVEQVTWNQVQEFIDKLNARTVKGYRLPTEAEWEYACRSGGKAELYCGGSDIDRLAWYANNSGNITTPVGQKVPNGLGLYDMSGNVQEWTCSAYVADYDGSETRCLGKNNPDSKRAFRGGSWGNVPGWVRSSKRFWGPSASRGNFLGFRLAQDKMP